MNFTSIFVLAVAIFCFIGIAFYLRSGRGRGSIFEGGAPDEGPGSDREEGGEIPGDDPQGNEPQGAHVLHIPAGMLGDRRNAFIHGRVEEAVRGFQMDENGEDAFIYTYTKELNGWVCPYCEGENKEESPICMICGRAPEGDVSESSGKE